MRSNNLRARLRECTRPHHQQIDALLSTLDLTDSAQYVRFLQLHAQALSVLANRTPPEDRADMLALLTCLHTDLDQYGVGRPMAPAPPASDSFAGQLGVAYVVRGSRLGAQVLMKRVAAAAPRAYLAYRPSTPWASFVRALDAFSQAHADEEAAVIAGAKAAFAVFRDAAQPRVLGQV